MFRFLVASSLLSFFLVTTALADTCCAHWGADGVCYQEYQCVPSEQSIPDPTPSSPPSSGDDPAYSRDEEGNLTWTCCAHWGADGVCHHEYQCK